MKEIIYVDEIPLITLENTKNIIFSISSNHLSDYTHGIHKYPAKFIPNIPRWAIKKFTKKEDAVLDTFCGSGTTLVESLLLDRFSYGVEISPLAKLITKVKITPLNKDDLFRKYYNIQKKIRINNNNKLWLPKHPNLTKWFKPETINRLAILREIIGNILNKDVKEYYLVLFSSIIRRVSNTENLSQKVYISSKYPKSYLDPYDIFSKICEKEIPKMIDFSDKIMENNVFAKIIGYDAKKIFLNKNAVKLAITSPPYINAIDYINVQKLEYLWLGLWSEEELDLIRRNQQIGTGMVYKDEWNTFFKEKSHYHFLSKIIKDIKKKSQKHAYIVYKIYCDIYKNLKEVYRVLKKNGRYVIVIGNNKIKDINVPNNDIVKEIAENIGYTIEGDFAYIIKNRLLRIPRKGRGGDINLDHVIVIKKE